MREIGVLEAQNSLGTLLDWVEQGEDVLITRQGRAAARRVPRELGVDRAKAHRAADGIVECRRGLRRERLRVEDLVRDDRS